MSVFQSHDTLSAPLSTPRTVHTCPGGCRTLRQKVQLVDQKRLVLGPREVNRFGGKQFRNTILLEGGVVS